MHTHFHPAATDRRPRPLLKWAGGKRQLLPLIRRFYPREFRSYFEPFAGSAAVFFDLVNGGALRGRIATLMDTNRDLIGCYLMVRDRTGEVIDALKELESGYRDAGGDHFYRIRDREFNPARAGARAEPSSPPAYTPRLAAMLIYLNRTGFNGLFRLNSKGLFNVPHGRYANPRICDERNLRAVAAALGQETVRILHASFDAVVGEAGPGDFIYFDPPYAPLSRTSVFTSYTAERFGNGDQRRLRDVVVALARRGCHVVVSNSTAPEIADLYDNHAMRALRIHAHRVPARRAINADPERRGNVEEFLITNVRPDATARERSHL